MVKAKEKDVSAMSYAEAVDEIETILARLSGDEVDVDELGREVKRASELIKMCREKLRKAEEDVNSVISKES